MPITLNGDSGITNVNGTAAAPAITGTDTDSGMYFGTNTVALSTSGTAAVTVDASQNVGIGTASPTYNFHVKETDGATSISSLFETTVAGGSYISFKDTGTAQPYNVRVGSVGEALAFQTSSAERMRITSAGGLAFGGAANYGTSGQVLQSNGDAVPTWVAAPSPTTSNVLAALTGMTANAVGSFTVCNQTSSGSVNIGSTIAGSVLRGTTSAGGANNPGFSGTWLNLGCSQPTTTGYSGASSMFVRIA